MKDRNLDQQWQKQKDLDLHLDIHELHLDEAETPDRWVPAHLELITDNSLSMTARMVHLRLLIFQGAGSNARPTIAQIAKEFDIKSPRTIHAAIQSLEVAGWIKVVRRKNPVTNHNMKNVYYLRKKSPSEVWKKEQQEASLESRRKKLRMDSNEPNSPGAENCAWTQDEPKSKNLRMEPGAEICAPRGAEICAHSKFTIPNSNSIHPTDIATSGNLGEEIDRRTEAKQTFQELADLCPKNVAINRSASLTLYMQYLSQGYEHDGLVFAFKKFLKRMKDQGRSHQHIPQLRYWLQNPDNKYKLDADYQSWKQSQDKPLDDFAAEEQDKLQQMYDEREKEIVELAKTDKAVAKAYNELSDYRKSLNDRSQEINFTKYSQMTEALDGAVEAAKSNVRSVA